MTLDIIIFDHVSSFLFAVTVVCVRDKESVHPRVLEKVVMHIVVKGDVFGFI